MAVRVLRWYPDTCECVFTLQHDDDLPFTGHQCRGAVPCPRHTGLGTNQQIYAAAGADNDIKNHAAEVIMGLVVRLQHSRRDSNGRTYNDFPDGVTYRWSLDLLRRFQLFLDNANLTEQERAGIQGVLDVEFGPGRVTIG